MILFSIEHDSFLKNLLSNQFFILFIIIQQFIDAKSNSTNNYPKEITIIKWEFHEFSTHITVMLFLIILVCLKLAYHYIPYISIYIPESLLLILIGITFGSIVFYTMENYPTDHHHNHNDHTSISINNTVWKFTPELFAYYLLPPIILESAYSLYNRTFSEYLGVVLIFSVIGTICNFLFIGFLLYIIYQLNLLGEPILQFNLKGYLLFSSLIVAVDPVAVLAIFQDIGVELSLYYIVFGESLFNDAITIVLNDIMIVFNNNEQLTILQIFIGFISFFTVSFGGLFIGILFGIITCLITRIHSHLSVFTILLLAYFSYIIADCIGWSGIISMISCGLIQAAYAFHNIGEKYMKSLLLITRMLAEISEGVIFLYLGIQVISYKLEWHTGFILWSLILCLLSRTIIVFIITAIVNYVNIDETKITIEQQIILIYGGLRGAIAFSLSVLIPDNLFPINSLYHKNIIVTTTLFIILFTVGFMGITMKPLVKLLKIHKNNQEKLSLFYILNKNIIDQTLTGIEILINFKGRNAIREFFIKIDENYIRRLLQRNPEHYDEKILKVYELIALKLLYASIRPNDKENLLKNIPESLKFNQLNQYSKNNLFHYGITHDWLLRNHLSMIPIDDDDDHYDGNLNNNNNNNNNDDDDDGGTFGESSFISAEQMMKMNMNKKQYRKISINANDIFIDHLSRHNNHYDLYASTSKHKSQLDLNEAFNDLLQYRIGAIKHQFTLNESNNNNNIEMNIDHHHQHTTKRDHIDPQKQSIKLERSQPIQQINNEPNETKHRIDVHQIDTSSSVEQHIQQSSYSLQPEIIDHRKRQDLNKNNK
ncbi:unnamed protein product [Schistosoma margrebowiei]|uniref:Sodium/hydrogen exchanger n=1 Tax=Schistosoma margrebowiei TaxID=48269 RepID=A0AA85AGL7_9TREM|nr:unnamed protein product [Schistosoma margrebowiei]